MPFLGTRLLGMAGAMKLGWRCSPKNLFGLCPCFREFCPVRKCDSAQTIGNCEAGPELAGNSKHTHTYAHRVKINFCDLKQSLEVKLANPKLFFVSFIILQALLTALAVWDMKRLMRISWKMSSRSLIPYLSAWCDNTLEDNLHNGVCVYLV